MKRDFHTPDPAHDAALAEVEHLLRATRWGLVVAAFRKEDGMVVAYRTRQMPDTGNELARLMREVPCRREAEAELRKRGRRG